MGLAASQARFLAITARKADCEFRSMQIAQNKLSVTRELQAATEKYHNSMNAEMLLWDYDGTSTDLQDLSYGLLMRPSVYNNYNPYLLTDRVGRIIVTDTMAAAAQAAGIDPDKGGTRSEFAFKKFMEALGEYKVVSGKTVEDVTKMVYPPNGAGQFDAAGRWTKDERWTYYNDNGGKIQSSTPYNVPVYLDKEGNYLGTVLKENPWDSSFANGTYDYEKYYNGERNNPPAGTATIAYAVYTGSKTSSVGSPGAIAGVLNGTYEANEISHVKFVSTNNYSSYSPNNGYGAEPMSKNGLSGLTMTQLAKRLSEYQKNDKGEIIRDDKGNPQTNSITIADYLSKLTLSDDKTAGFNIIKNGTALGKDNADQVSLSDILSGTVYIVSTQKDGDHNVDTSNVCGFSKDFFEAGAGKIKEALGICGDYESVYNMAVKMTEAQFFNVRSISYGGTSVTDNIEQSKRYASTYNEVVFLQNSGGKRNSTASVNLTNVFNYFLTMMTILEDGFNSEYCVAADIANCNFVTDDPTYRFVVEEDGTETNEAIMKSDFYQQLFNNLCINGYKVDKRVQSDNGYMDQMLKNGSYFITSLGNDGHFYQARYCDAEYTLIKVVADEDAIAKAEAEYNYAKIKLTAKEDKLDLDMKNIDMEISALTTEYESVKNLIAKSIEKTFKQFES